MTQPLNVVAVLACRNEADYLPTCLHHLIANGLKFAVVDHGSTDGSLDIVHSDAFRPHLAGLERIPFDGTFTLRTMLDAKMRLGEASGADWLMNVCPDEILHSNRPGRTLVDEVSDFDDRGFNAANFDEFVFLPVEGPLEDGLRGWPSCRHYYFFEPRRFRQYRLWKTGLGFSMANRAGSRLGGRKLRLAPESLVLRHYIFRSQAHAREKLVARRFAAEELERGWHGDRNGFGAEAFTFPPASALKMLSSPDSFVFERTDPWKDHYWIEPAGGRPRAA